MIKKEELLQSVTMAAREGIVMREEITHAYDEGVRETQSNAPSTMTDHRLGLSEILYYLGGGIVVLGISIFIRQNWDDLSPVTRILSTLGVGMIAYFNGVLLSRKGNGYQWGMAFHLISAVTLPIGMFVTLDQCDVDVSGFGIASAIFAFLTILYGLSYRVFQKNLFMFFWVLFGTILFFHFTNFLAMDSMTLFEEWKFFAYQFLIIGSVYLLLGYAFVHGSKKPLTKYLYAFGLLFFFGSTLALGGWSPEQNVFWELLFPGLALGATFLSVSLRSRSFLVIGSIALIAYIFKITGEYFTDSLGWPLALVIAGLALIAVGALFVQMNKRYKEVGVEEAQM